MTATARLRCKCSNTYQDAMYGKLIRIFNRMTKGEGTGQAWYRCTSCGRERLQ